MIDTSADRVESSSELGGTMVHLSEGNATTARFGMRRDSGLGVQLDRA